MNTFWESRYWLTAGWTMVHFGWVGIVLGSLVFLLKLGLRRSSPKLRYAVGLISLTLVVASPAVIFSLLLSQTPNRQQPLAQRPTTKPAGRQSTVIKALVRQPAQAGRSVKPAGAAAATVREVVVPDRQLLQMVVARLGSVVDRACHYLPWFWLIGAPITFGILATGLAGAERLRRDSRPLESAGHGADWVSACRRFSTALGIARQVAIRVSDRVLSPILVGVFRPIILLPPAVVTGFSAEQIEMVLWHELAHLRRYDNLVNLAQRIAEALLFFHPVVWWLSAWIRLEREQCCDAFVLSQTGRRQAYAETLAALAMPGLTPGHAAAAMAHHHLVVRIRHILDLEDRSMKVSRKLLTAVATLLVATAYLVVVHAQQPSASDLKAVGDQSGPATNAQGPNTKPGSVGRGEGFQLALPQGGAQSSFVLTEGTNGIQVVSFVGQTQQATWGPEQATGAPNTPEAGDYPTAWASETPDGQEEWLDLGYAEPVEAAAVAVYESFNCGALSKVCVFGPEGQAIQAWTGNDPTQPGTEKGVSIIPLQLKKQKINRVRIYLNSPAVQGWNEIDAVGLLDAQGIMHWATSATASSTYANRTVHQQSGWGDVYVGQPSDHETRIRRLEEQVQRLEAVIAELRKSQVGGPVIYPPAPFQPVVPFESLNKYIIKPTPADEGPAKP